MVKARPKAIVFDFFGVIVTEGLLTFLDTYFQDDPVARKQAVYASRAANTGAISMEDFEGTLSALAGISLEKVKKHINNNVPNEPLLRYISEELKPHYKIGLLSNAADNWLDDMLQPDQVALFDAIALSYEMGVAKPDTEAYLAIAERLEVHPEECVFTDDIGAYCEAAKNVGMRAVVFKDLPSLRAELEPLLQ